jgi:D-threo-aldose 1-dehydrogenase
VTRLGLGCSPLANLYAPVIEQTARDTVTRALELGLRFFDTAPLYGYGVSEQRVGQALASVPREEFTLATKVGRLLRADAPVDESMGFEGDPFFKDTPPVNPTFDFSYDGVKRSFEESLERLGLERVDVLHIHDSGAYLDDVIAGAFPALDELRSQGVIAAIGAGMSEPDVATPRALDLDCLLLAGRYTLLDQTGLEELLPLCGQRGIAVIIGGVYNSGILAAPQAGATFEYKPASAELIERAERLDQVCARHGVPLKAAAIQFPFGHPAVVSVIIGSRSAAELDENVAMFNTPIQSELWDELRAEGLLAPDVPVPAPS